MEGQQDVSKKMQVAGGEFRAEQSGAAGTTGLWFLWFLWVSLCSLSLHPNLGRD